MSSEMCTSLVRDHQAAISRWHSLFYFPLRAPALTKCQQVRVRIGGREFESLRVRQLIQ
jgi:hypothetical protein